MSDIPYKVEGIFYTKRDGPIQGIATVVSGRWFVQRSNGESFNRTDIFLDKDKRVAAPKSDLERDNSQSYVRGIIDKYQKQVDSLDHDAYKEISGNYKMEFAMANSLLTEYKRIYANYFRSNAVKFMFDDEWEKSDK